MPDSERSSRVWTNDELCVLDDQRFFLYGSIELPILGHDDSFLWGAWAEIGEGDFFAYQDAIGVEGRESMSPICGTLATDIPFYPPTLGMSLRAVIQPKGLRPLFALDGCAHPLFKDHRQGVAPQRIVEINRWFSQLEGKGAA